MILKVKFFLVINLLLLPTRTPGQQRIDSLHLLEDCRILSTTLKELHPDLYRYTREAEFTATADSIMKSLRGSLSPIEFYVRISPVVTQIKNGHTAIRLPQKVCDPIKVLPLRLISFEGKVYVSKDFSESKSDLIGTEIKTINGVAVSEIVRGSLNFVSVDGFNENARFKAVVEDDLALYNSLLYGGSEEFEIEYVTQNVHQSLHCKLKGMSYQEFLSRYDEGNEFPWSLTRIDSSNAALLTVRSFNNVIVSDDTKMYFNKTIGEFFRQIKEWRTEQLILDIRFNGGGELKNSILLYAYLMNTSFQFTKQIEMASLVPPTFIEFTNYKKALKYGPIRPDHAVKKSDNVFYITGHFSQKAVAPRKDNFTGKLVVLVNGNTASAAGALASCIKSDKRGLIVGEENRDNYTGFSAGVPVLLTLPHSGLVVSIPIRKFTYATGEDTGRGIVPDYAIPSTADDFFNRKNAVLDFAIGLLKK